MKRKSILITLIICASIVCLFFVVFLINSYSNDNKNSNLSTTSVEANNNKHSPGYYLGEYDGKLAAFTTESDEPLQVFDVYLSSLPEDDIEKIREGVYAKDEQDLQRLIEDFTS